MDGNDEMTDNRAGWQKPYFSTLPVLNKFGIEQTETFVINVVQPVPSLDKREF